MKIKTLSFSLFCCLALLLGLESLFGEREANAQRSRTASSFKYGGGETGQRYSPLRQINRANVGRLEIAWQYDGGDGAGDSQTQPVIVDGVLYGVSAKHKIFALDAATGKELWRFDSGLTGRGPNRGVSIWSDGKERRIFAAVQSYVYALDAATGKAIPSFGANGRIDLREGLERDPGKISVVLTTPGSVYKDLLIVSGRMGESLPSALGDIRAFDVRTGKQRWAFHTIPRPGEYGYDTWPKDAWTYTGSANNWAGMAVDEQRGIVFVPTGSAADDFYGANRVGDNLFANTLLALDAATGKRLWHFQAVKHDIWDRDFPSPPTLVTVKQNGKRIDGVAQTTKSGHVYLFERATGKPLFPIETKSYPASEVPGEVSAATQPLSTKPTAFSRQMLSEDVLTNRTPEARAWALAELRKMNSKGQFVPINVGKETIIFPGFDGGAEWGGSAFDPETGLLYVNANEMAWRMKLTENQAGNSGRQLYNRNCATCHGDDLSGSPPQIPSLKAIGSKFKAENLTTIIRQGAGRMPAFTALSQTDLAALTEFLLSGEDKELATKADPIRQRFRFTGYIKFLDPDGYPAIAPPWGTLNAINLNTGEYAWKIPLGEYPELATKGLKDTGSENYGGPVVTAGGLVFIAATNFDRKFRAFDKRTGKLLWETTLPFSGNATPAVYEVGGKQFVVVHATGGKAQKDAPKGDLYIAFALQK
ncbi:MAG: PQQ-binding-like beta-propeller repeat protein [Acidobacteria bacterium]|nr:PQQ-binding-like beta-propeller repeat protein [Acidobacteriota bacterium]